MRGRGERWERREINRKSKGEKDCKTDRIKHRRNKKNQTHVQQYTERDTDCDSSGTMRENPMKRETEQTMEETRKRETYHVCAAQASFLETCPQLVGESEGKDSL